MSSGISPLVSIYAFKRHSLWLGNCSSLCFYTYSLQSFPHLTAKESFYKCKSYHVTLVLRIFQWLFAALKLESKQTPCMDRAYQSKYISYSFFSCFPHPYHPGHFRAFEQGYFSSWNVFSHPLDFRISKQKSTHNLREVLSSLSKVHPCPKYSLSYYCPLPFFLTSYKP